MRWEKVEGIGEGPGKRWGHTFNAVKGGKLLYLFGGYGKFNCQTNQVHVFDTESRRWSEAVVKGPPPTPRDSHSCTVVGDNLFVFGGTDGTRLLKDLYILHTSSHTWIFPTVGGDLPEAREGHGAAIVGKQMFVFGGCGRSADNNNEVYYNDLYILNTETFIWTRATTSGTPPSPRDSHTCSSWKNQLLVLGGEDQHDYYLSDVHILDTDTLVWRELCTSGQLLPPRAGHSTVSFGKNLFVFGGFTEAQILYSDLYMLDIETGVWTKVTTTSNGPSARFSVDGDCLDPYMSGVLVFIGGCNRSLEALDDMYYLYTGIARESELRPEKLSIRKQLKLKCLEQNLNLVQNPVLYGYGMGAGSNQPMAILNSQLSGLNIPVNQSLPSGKKMFQAKVKERHSAGYTIETVIDGKPLRGILFSTKPDTPNPVTNISSRKRTAGEIGSVVSNSATTSKVLKQERMEDRQELRRGSSEYHEHHNEADTVAISSTPTTDAESFKVSVNPEPEAVSLNRNDGSSDVTSSKGEVQTGDQINVPVSNYEIPRQTSDAPNYNTDVLEPAAAESAVTIPQVSVNPEPEAVSLNLNDEQNDTPKSLIESLKNDGSSDVTSSKGAVQADDQINMPVSNYEIPRQTSDAPNYNTDVPEPAAAESAMTIPQVSVNLEPEAVSLNRNGEKNDTPKSLIESLKSDGSSDVTSSKGAVQADDQINMPVSNYEIPRQTGDAPIYNTDVQEPAAAESAVTIPQVSVNPEPEAVSLNLNDEKNDTPKSLIESLKSDGSSDVTSSKGAVEADDQINMPVSNYEIPRQTSDAPNYNTDVPEPAAAESAVTIPQVSVNPEPEAVSFNLNDEKNDTPKSLIESLKNDGSSDVTSSEGAVQYDDQINMPVSNYEIPRQTSDAPNYNTDVPEPAAAESAVTIPQVSVNPEPEAVSLNLNDEKNDTPKSLIESLKNDGSSDVTSSEGAVQSDDQINMPVSNYEIPRQTGDAPNYNTDVPEPAAAESAVCPSNQGVTGDCTTPRTEGDSDPTKLTLSLGYSG